MQQAGNAEAGAGTEQGHRCAGHRLASADPAHFGRRKRRDGERKGREVVQHEQTLEAEAATQGLDGNGPLEIGHGHRVAGDRRGDGDGASGRSAAALRGEIVGDGSVESGMLAAWIARDLGNALARSGHPAKT